MDAAQKPRMTADEFIAWSMAQPKGQRYELSNGEVFGMAPERWYHTRVKGRIFRRFEEAVDLAGLRCEVASDGMAVRIDADTVYEPDAAIRCGEPLSTETVVYDDPMVVVEVLSPSSRAVDGGIKLSDYFRLTSVCHYLIIRTDRRLIVHHERGADGIIQTQIVASGQLRLAPPGITLDVASLFP